ncbi:MAG: PEGA domain-containing protein [Deltaproteobacteria bacterium]|nr:PEGA domain-containing protein [Deltaproteobacteria bacterium]
MLAWLLVLLAWLGPAHGQPGKQPSAADRETARTLMDEGANRLQAKDFAGAIDAFRAADQLVGMTTTGLWLARAQIALGKLLEARDTLVRVQGLPAAASESPQLAAARRQAAELALEVADRIPSIQVKVGGVPQGIAAQVTVDGEPLPPAAAALPRKLDPGTHSVVVSAPGFAPATRQVTLSDRENRIIEIPLAPAAEPEPPMTRTGPAPEPKPTPAGRPAPAAGLPAKPSAPPPAVRFGPAEPEQPATEPSGISAVAWAGFGVGAAGLIVGAVAGIVAVSKTAEVRDHCPDNHCPEEQREAWDSSLAVAHVSTAGFVVGGLGAALGVVGLMGFGGEPEPKEPAAGTAMVVQPVLEPGVVGVNGRI